jgi:hypothetical protein
MEVSTLVQSIHQNIICLYGYGAQKKICFIIMEVMDGDLFSLILKRLKSNRYNGSPFKILEALISCNKSRGFILPPPEQNCAQRFESHNILVRCVKATNTCTVGGNKHASVSHESQYQ